MNEPIDTKHWRAEIDQDGIAWLHVNVSGAGANVLSSEVLAELEQQLAALSAQPPRGLVILSDKPNGFMAGADVKEFTTFTDSAQAYAHIRRAQSVFDELEHLPCPSVSLIHGFCLGGGLELALACTYRVAEDDARTRLGLPEVRLGIHPGFGGTVRLPQRVGTFPAMDMMLSGRTLDARAAKKLGLVDQAVPARHLQRAARSLILSPPTPRRLPFWNAATTWRQVRPWVARLLRRKVSAHAPEAHYPAPYALIDLWVHYADDPQRMLDEEAVSVARLLTDPTARNLIRVFLLQERLKSLGRAGDFAPKHVHVIGAGAMGGDIAAWCALHGLRVTLQDPAPDHIGASLKRAYALFQKRLKRPRLVQAAWDRLIPDGAGHGLSQADVVIEAVFEDIAVKQKLFRDIEPRLKPDAVLATNTSSIPLDVLGAVLARPERLVGLHFFNPVAKMQLVEVVDGPATDPEIARRACAFVRRIDHLPLPVKSSPGFLVNRLLMPYLLEAVTLENEGVPGRVIDQAAVDFGMPLGPIELADTVGLDICLSVADILSQRLSIPVPPRLRQLVEAGYLGRKSGRGFYQYRSGGPPTKEPLEKGYQPPRDITDRLMLRLINEAAACLRQGVVADVDLLDAGMVFGTGFAPFRGGPLRYAQETGVTSLLETLQRLERAHGARFAADPGWQMLLQRDARP
ncbi:MAG: enoyl-CoA hydratase/isomerase family protein [Gammaproteobacteria bacterium]|nr:enoyl-CoA hydratase/isomerase family protein [Gammaproteobacteria bacterium]